MSQQLQPVSSSNIGKPEFYQGSENRKNGEVEHPAHYGGDTVYECIKVARAWMSEEAFRGAMVFNVLKYLCRWEKKGGLLSLKKGLFYYQKLVSVMEEAEQKNKPLVQKVAEIHQNEKSQNM